MDLLQGRKPEFLKQNNNPSLFACDAYTLPLCATH
jgi:hypothetical protein